MKKNYWESKKFIVVAHEASTGPPQELRNFLVNKKIKNVFFIAHPLLYFKDGYSRSSKYNYYKNGKLIKSGQALHWKLPEPALYIKDIIYTIIWCANLKEKYDLFFGVNNLNALAGIFLKKLGKVKKVVYYNIDYTPKRFNNKVMNYIYHKIDKYCCYNADINWVGTTRTTEARINNGLKVSKMAKTVIVPDGNHSLKIEKINNFNKNKSLVYVGYIMKKQGIDLVIESLSEIVKKMKNIKFIIVGTGDYDAVLKKKVNELRLNKFIEFKGFIADDREVEKLVSQSSIGVATYTEDKDSFTYYSEAGKPKLYLGCGIPVILTNVPAIAVDIKKEKAGEVINYNKDQFVKAVLKILKDEKAYESYKNSAVLLGNRFDWSNIFSKGLGETINT